MQEQGLGAVLWKGRWLILVSVIVGIGVAVVLSQRSSKVYRGTALLQVNQSGQVGANASDIFNAQQASQNLALTYATEINSASFLERIRSQVAGGRYTASALRGLINSSAVTNTGLLSISAQGASPARAQLLAHEVAQAFLSVLAQDGDAQAAARSQVVQARIATLSSSIASLSRRAAAGDAVAAAQLSSERRALDTMTQQLGNSLSGGSLQGTQVSLVGPPTALSSPVSPRPVLNIVAGALLGLLVGIALAWLRVRLDTGLHSGDEAAAILEVPNLASIPRARAFARTDPLQDRSVRDAYDVLQTNLRFSSGDRAGNEPVAWVTSRFADRITDSVEGERRRARVRRAFKVIALASYRRGEGKTSVARGLADATLRADQNVLVVDGDLRVRSLTEAWGYGAAPGVSTAVMGHHSDGVVEIEPGLFFLPAGPPPPSPVSLLYSHQMRELIDEMRSRYSLVIIDSPPASHLADASVWASMSDAVVVVARAGVTKRAHLTALATNLGPSPTPIVGVVVFEQRGSDVPYRRPGAATPKAADEVSASR